MALLDANIVEQLKAYFDKIEEPIEIAAFLNDSDKSKELDSFLQEVDAISNKVNYTRKTFGEDKSLEETAGITRPTSFTLLKGGKKTGINFYGIPGGHEFTSFILGIYNVSGPGQGLSDDIKEKILAIKEKVSFKILVSLSCTMCPDLVVAVQRIASLNPLVDAQVYDINHFGDLREKYHVMSVPCLVMNEDKVFFGKKSIEEVLDYINN